MIRRPDALSGKGWQLNLKVTLTHANRLQVGAPKKGLANRAL